MLEIAVVSFFEMQTSSHQPLVSATQSPAWFAAESASEPRERTHVFWQGQQKVVMYSKKGEVHRRPIPKVGP